MTTPAAEPVGSDATGEPHGRQNHIVCVLCREAAGGFRYECARCGGPLVVAPEQLGELRVDPTRHGIWHYRSLLPATTAEVTLGEGGTPLVALSSSVSGLGADVHAKLESLNPTLSFKDRAMALGVSKAKDFGLRGLVVASTGNAAVSAAAYAAAAGLDCRVVVGTESNALKKLDACRAFGAQVEEVPGDYSAAYAIARSGEGEGWMNVSTTYRNPLLAEGYRSIAFELLEQLGATPAKVVVPIGAGPLLRGIERGFQDALHSGRTQTVPQLIGVQAASVAPIYREWTRRHGGTTARPVAPAHQGGPTIATAIADRLTGYEAHGDITIAAVERSRGSIVAVGEAAILDADRRLASAGIWVEPSAATALAALSELPDVDTVAGPIVLMLTGHGAKAPTALG